MRYIKSRSIPGDQLQRGMILSVFGGPVLVTNINIMTGYLVCIQLQEPYLRDIVANLTDVDVNGDGAVILKPNPSINEWRIYGGYRGGVFGKDLYPSK